jgi:hypothetical protein
VRKKGGKKMAEKKDNQKEFSTCLEGSPMAEMMKKMLGQQGIGSLCTEMMKKVMEKPGEGFNLPCAGMMKEMMKGCCSEKESKESGKEKGHVGDK